MFPESPWSPLAPSPFPLPLPPNSASIPLSFPFLFSNLSYTFSSVFFLLPRPPSLFPSPLSLPSFPPLYDCFIPKFFFSLGQKNRMRGETVGLCFCVCVCIVLPTLVCAKKAFLSFQNKEKIFFKIYYLQKKKQIVQKKTPPQTDRSSPCRSSWRCCR